MSMSFAGQCMTDNKMCIRDRRYFIDKYVTNDPTGRSRNATHDNRHPERITQSNALAYTYHGKQCQTCLLYTSKQNYPCLFLIFGCYTYIHQPKYNWYENEETNLYAVTSQMCIRDSVRAELPKMSRFGKSYGRNSAVKELPAWKEVLDVYKRQCKCIQRTVIDDIDFRHLHALRHA